MFKIDNSYLDIINKRKELEITNIQKCNEYTNKYGLTLSNTQITNIIETRKEVLKSFERVEFRESIINKMIKEFCDSPYISQANYYETLCELIEIFYEYKNETFDLISDDELIEFMKNSFDNICQGDLEYLSGTVMYKMKQNILQCKPLNYEMEEDENLD